MTPILIIFCIFFALSALVLLNKDRELVKGKGYFKLGDEKLDSKLISRYEKFLDAIHHLTISTAKQYIQKITVSIENYSIKLFHYLSKRFYSLSNIITGHNIPKNRGSASFFLKNIEEHKKTVSGR
jgi:hypothetical protein